ncbi:hypothetical protein [Spiroplasma endosymbiont of Cantharis lateralis]|uniref:hypothetical protein n=1 Tax=Spiroplasma endosymbiont of Cantharis lateralis TaxID=3066277 RepID=UPI00313BB625
MIDREEDIQEIILTDYSLAIGNETNDVIVLFDFYGIDSKGRINGIWYQEYRFDIDKNVYPNFDNVKIVLEVE